MHTIRAPKDYSQFKGLFLYFPVYSDDETFDEKELRIVTPTVKIRTKVLSVHKVPAFNKVELKGIASSSFAEILDTALDIEFIDQPHYERRIKEYQLIGSGKNMFILCLQVLTCVTI